MVARGHAWLQSSVCGCWGCVWLLGVCMVARVHAWLWGGMCGCQGACMVVRGMHGCWGACVVARGHAWLPGDVCVVARGVVVGGCMVVGEHVWDMTRYSQ